MTSKTAEDEKLSLIFQGNIEALDQAKKLLIELSDEQYCEVPSQYTESSIGQHMRHILDIYQAIFQAIMSSVSPLIDYDVRRRGGEIEVNRLAAIAQIDAFISQFEVLGDAYQPALQLQVSTEVLLSSQEAVVVLSKLDRELVFASSHTVHHLALIGVIAKLLGIFVPESFGVAPSTASFLRHRSLES